MNGLGKGMPAGAILVLVGTMALASPAQAAGGVADRVGAALAGTPTKYGVLDSVVSSEGASPLAGSKVEVPRDPSVAIGLTSDRGTLTVVLPFASAAADGIDVGEGIIAFDNLNGSLTVPITKSGGSVQITTVVEDSVAPERFEYVFTLPRGASMTEAKGGVITIVGSDGDFIGGVAPAWAVDAGGTVVPTHYEVEGAKLTQVIDHSKGDFRYPIVADPWLGLYLFQAINVNSFLSQPRVNLAPSSWGLSMWNTLSGHAIMNTAGWDEALTWTFGPQSNSVVRNGLNKPSQRQQFECHVAGSPFAGWWNLEKYRLNRTVWWGYGVGTHHCNWNTANGL